MGTELAIQWRQRHWPAFLRVTREREKLRSPGALASTISERYPTMPQMIIAHEEHEKLVGIRNIAASNENRRLETSIRSRICSNPENSLIVAETNSQDRQ